MDPSNPQDSAKFDSLLQQLNQLIAQTNAASANTELKATAAKSYELIENVSLEVLARIKRALRYFYLRNVLLVIVVTLMMVLFFGQYINGEWPWETHQRVVQEREIGHAIITEWPNMDEQVKTYLLNKILPTGIVEPGKA